ncbi:MAG: TIGR04552 family protein [Myxococcales bacterium]|nr:TIGR04552 family protein [Myxococcales bacterium]MCB9537992.1 TIGR04552 family protein [Myxococcales bacterium]
MASDTPPGAPAAIQTSLADAGVLPYGLQDVEQVRLMLRGDSVVDWKRLACVDIPHANQLLERAGIRPHEPGDMMRLVYLHRRALDYIDAHHDGTLSAEVRTPSDPRELLLLASRNGPAQLDACMVLKVMHIVHHVAGRELLYRLPVPINELFHRIETAVFDAVDGMKAGGIRVAEFAGSRKTPDSVVTKLLCRSDSQAAEIHDRLRFRVVTETLEDLFAALVYLTRHLLPFNYVVPGQSRNDLIDLSATLHGDPRLRQIGELLQDTAYPPGAGPRPNHFSARGFRMVNFVVDMPVFVDDLIGLLPGYTARDGHVVFLLVEFQLMDAETDRANNSGANRHELYKARQHARVVERLLGKGL